MDIFGGGGLTGGEEDVVGGELAELDGWFLEKERREGEDGL